MNSIQDEADKKRKQEEELLSQSFQKIASSIVGHKIGTSQSRYDESFDNSITQLLNYFNIEKKDAPSSFNSTEEILDFHFSSSGVMYREVTLKKGWYKESIGAFLATFEGSENVVALLPTSFGNYVFTDPKTGKKRRVNAKIAGSFNKKAFCFYRPLPQRPIDLIDFIYFLKDCISGWDVLSYILAMCVITGIGLITTQINYLATGLVISNQSYQLLSAIIIFSVFLIIGNSLFGVIRQLLMNRVQFKIGESVRAATMMRLLSLPPNFFKDYSSGELNQHLEYMNSLCSSIVNIVISSGITGAFSLVYIVQIFSYAEYLVWPSIIVSLATVLISILSSKVQILINKKKMNTVSKERGLVYDFFKGIQKIRISGSENRAFSKWADLYAQEAKLNYNPPVLVTYNSIITTAISLIGMLVIYYIAAIKNVSVADYYAFNAAYSYVSTAFVSISSIALTVGTIKPVLDLVAPIMRSDIEEQNGKTFITSLKGKIEFSHISFKYSKNAPTIFKDLCIKIEPKEYVAIVGKTGCGKSTLIRLLLNFEEPESGSIFFDGRDSIRLNMRQVRRNIGTVTQDGKLLEGSIFDNIAMMKPSLSTEEAWEAAEIAGLADDIRAMPMGMNTRISGNGGGNLSGGQRQRLLIARAVAPKPKLLIFDEATSALDNVTQKSISESIDKMNCTRIVIAHRLSTIINCDKILVLDKGVIAEEGTYDSLIEKNGIFADLVRNQTL